MAITTKEGDFGISKFLGMAVEKDSTFIQTMGMIDGLQCCLGVSKSFITKENWREEIDRTQKNLIIVSGVLTMRDKWRKGEDELKFLEEKINEMEERTPSPLAKGFVVAGENHAEAFLSLSRSFCRIAEEKIVALKKEQHVDGNILKYFNRLSDYLFLGAIEQTKK